MLPRFLSLAVIVGSDARVRIQGRVPLHYLVRQGFAGAAERST